MGSRSGAKIHSRSQLLEPIKLSYALPAEAEHSAWSLLGCILSLLLMGLVGLLSRDMWDVIRFGGYADIRTHPTEYSLALIPLACCVMGLQRGKRLLAILGMVITMATLIFAIIAAAGSPWNTPPVIGCCGL